MKELAKKILPKGAQKSLRRGYKVLCYHYRFIKFKQAANQNKPMKIVVGAGESFQKGWFSTNENWLDITQKAHWNKFLNGPSLTHVMAEHVFEHLTEDQAQAAANLIFNYLLPGGRLRIAVPDGNNPNPEYIRHVGINGIGADASDHKQLYTIETLSQHLEQAGFSVQHIEGYTGDGKLVQAAYSDQDGFIRRSRKNPEQCHLEGWNFPDSTTSLIVDGIKPLKN